MGAICEEGAGNILIGTVTINNNYNIMLIHTLVFVYFSIAIYRVIIVFVRSQVS